MVVREVRLLSVREFRSLSVRDFLRILEIHINLFRTTSMVRWISVFWRLIKNLRCIFSAYCSPISNFFTFRRVAITDMCYIVVVPENCPVGHILSARACWRQCDKASNLSDFSKLCPWVRTSRDIQHVLLKSDPLVTYTSSNSCESCTAISVDQMIEETRDRISCARKSVEEAEAEVENWTERLRLKTESFLRPICETILREQADATHRAEKSRKQLQNHEMRLSELEKRGSRVLQSRIVNEALLYFDTTNCWRFYYGPVAREEIIIIGTEVPRCFPPDGVGKIHDYSY